MHKDVLIEVIRRLDVVRDIHIKLNQEKENKLLPENTHKVSMLLRELEDGFGYSFFFYVSNNHKRIIKNTPKYGEMIPKELKWERNKQALKSFKTKILEEIIEKVIFGPQNY